jgi:hypothetical protein
MGRRCECLGMLGERFGYAELKVREGERLVGYDGRTVKHIPAKR